MIPLDNTHRAVHYPDDRRFRIWLRPGALILLLVIVLTPILVAWAQHALFDLPYIAPNLAAMEGAASGPHGFPAWIRWSHFFNLFFVFMLIRSGLSILVDHPRLYWNDHCTPGDRSGSALRLCGYRKIASGRPWMITDTFHLSWPHPAIGTRLGLHARGTSSTFMGSFSPACSLSWAC